tara:strand:+ start:181 stop:669 length:489 start_codon:yes stop_codon:yes gene_type:complete
MNRKTKANIEMRLRVLNLTVAIDWTIFKKTNNKFYMVKHPFGIEICLKQDKTQIPKTFIEIKCIETVNQRWYEVPKVIEKYYINSGPNISTKLQNIIINIVEEMNHHGLPLNNNYSEEAMQIQDAQSSWDWDAAYLAKLISQQRHRGRGNVVVDSFKWDPLV